MPVEDVWVDGPGGRIHALLRRPVGSRAGRCRSWSTSTAARPTTTPTSSAPGPPPGSTTASPSSRSTTAARPATARPGGTPSRRASGHVELEDVVAVRDHLVAAGIADPATRRAGRRVVGRVPHAARPRHASPTAGRVGRRRRAGGRLRRRVRGRDGGRCKAFDRSLFGGSPERGARDVPGRRRSPTSTPSARRC